MGATIDILLATYNGERHLGRQIDSILCQTDTSWRILIRDDCSSDGTPAIIARYVADYPDRISLVCNNGENLGVCGNFNRLLQHSTAEYLMFCDQDDLWLPDKIRLTLERLTAMENELGKTTPLLVHTDMKVANDKLEIQADSFWDYQQLDPSAGTRLNRLVLQNVPSGCAMMFNRALADKAMPIPADAFMHDWWIALVASAFGRIGFVREPTTLYRQHERNVSGATRWHLLPIIRDFCSPSARHIVAARRNRIFARLEKQSAAFLRRYAGELGPRERDMLRRFSNITRLSFLERRYVIIRYGIWYKSLIDNLGMLLFR